MTPKYKPHSASTILKATDAIEPGDVVLLPSGEHTVDTIGPYVHTTQTPVEIPDWETWRVAHTATASIALIPGAYVIVAAPTTTCPVCGDQVPIMPAHDRIPETLIAHSMGYEFDGDGECSEDPDMTGFETLYRALVPETV